HRRSQSLPPKLGVKLFIPPPSKLALVFTNPNIHTYRLHSGLGGDISVQEIMLESQLCYIIPQQLLSIWIAREKELLQEISGMGELGGEWRHRQMELLDKHLKLLKDYSQAKQFLAVQQQQGKHFKPSAKKADETLEFAPVNLHLQRMWAHNDTLMRAGVLDVTTVGAFTRHSGKSKTGGLIKLLQQIKDATAKDGGNSEKVAAANDAVQAIKQLRKEIVEIMSQLLYLAKSKNPKGMLPLCNDMMTKTRALLNIWEPNLVEEAFAFIERHRIIEDPTQSDGPGAGGTGNPIPMSPFKKITQQLGALDLKSPELEDFSTPMGPAPDLWPQVRTSKSGVLGAFGSSTKSKSPSSVDISTIATIQNTFNQMNNSKSKDYLMSCSLPAACYLPTEQPKEFKSKKSTPTEASASGNELKFSETHFDNELLSNVYDENGYLIENTAIVLGHNGAFLDTKVMSSSPSANYYRPTEEPEPLDLTQLNIEASVMCLVSKVKFLCGRCGSPAVRLRQPKGSIKSIRGVPFGTIPPDVDLLPGPSGKPPLCSKDLNLALTQAVGEVTRKVKKGNKFTDGLDLSLTTDWASELRPSMKKLRQAMDGLLKTARLMHSVQRLQQDMKRTSTVLAVMYRRDVCFSQALTALVSALMAKLWGQNVTENYISLLCNLGPLACFEGFLSLYGSEADMWGDMGVAIADMGSVSFTLVRSNIQRDSKALPVPRVIGTRQQMSVLLPVPE
ncbi:AAEL014358-PA, partial [Aedes aegypti]